MPPSGVSSEIDFHHPLFLYPSDNPGGLLVSHQLVGAKNYNLWSRSMRIALLAKNKLGFVDGDCKKANYDETLHPQWERCNAFVLSWILNTVSRDLSTGIVFASSAAHVWANLKEKIDKGDGARVYFLHREISTLSQGLNDTYSAIRSQILLMKPLPTANQAYSMIIQEESQRVHLFGISPLSEPTSMYSAAPERRRFNGSCDYYKIKGHKRENYYRLNGFPADFKFTKTRGSSAALAVNPSLPSAPGNSLPPSAPAFTPDQYSQLLSLLNQVPSTDSAANMAGIASANTPCCFSVAKRGVQWVQDTGATDHMLSDLHSLLSPLSCASQSKSVHLPRSSSLEGYWGLVKNHMVFICSILQVLLY